MKKFIIFLSICIFSYFNVSPIVVCAASNSKDNIDAEIGSNIADQLNNLDLSGLDSYLNDLNFNLYNQTSFSDLVASITKGDYFLDFNGIVNFVLNFLFGNVKSVIPFLFLIIAIAVLGSIVNNLKSDKLSGGVSDLVHFLCYAVIILILAGIVTNIISASNNVLSSMLNQMQIIFPIMLTMLTSVGAVVSVGIYKPIVSILSQVIGFVFAKFLFPLFVLSFLFLIVGNLSKNIKLNKFNDLFASVFKWSVGFIFTMFSAFLTIQGISAGKFDGISIKATKFAVKSYIPLVGGYLSDGFDLIMCASVLIKNAVGVAGLLIMFTTIIKPIVYILTVKFGLQLVSAILEPIGDGRISNFTSSASKILIYPVVIILSVAFMYVLSAGLIMTTANVF